MEQLILACGQPDKVIDGLMSGTKTLKWNNWTSSSTGLLSRWRDGAPVSSPVFQYVMDGWAGVVRVMV
ncbi:hypothetical protein BgiBS90_035363 [Biomphalaria glabrata]|nr:hypothetical protein BgiBS90_035363 [Biomphalaria glabrata]